MFADNECRQKWSEIGTLTLQDILRLHGFTSFKLDVSSAELYHAIKSSVFEPKLQDVCLPSLKICGPLQHQL